MTMDRYSLIYLLMVRVRVPSSTLLGEEYGSGRLCAGCRPTSAGARALSSG
jgi:hypothetical protein